MWPLSTKHGMKLYPMNLYNQSVENAGVAYVKGANIRNEFFKKLTNSNVCRTSPDEKGKG